MSHFKSFITFYVPYLIFLITLLVLILFYDKAELHLKLSSFHTPNLDLFFKNFTEIGGSFPYLVIVVMLFFRYKVALFLFITQVASGLFSKFIKQMFNAPRPIKYFAENFPDIQLYHVPGVELHTNYSLPSGHTITAFAFFLSLAFYTQRKDLHFVYFVCAALVGFSRIYLSQHFALDVLVGAMVGVAVTVSWKFYYDDFSSTWSDGSVLNLFTKKK